MYFIIKNLLSFSILLENISTFLKEKLAYYFCTNFLKRFKLIDINNHISTNISYSNYERTNLIIIERLIERNIISNNDIFFDIGCGTGILLFYLAQRGFKFLYGVECDTSLYDICQKNLISYNNITKSSLKINFININIENYIFPSNITIFYLYNPFNTTFLYSLCFKKIYKSYCDNIRKIKVIIFNPTQECINALLKIKWVRKRYLLYIKDQVCYKCNKFFILET